MHFRFPRPDLGCAKGHQAVHHEELHEGVPWDEGMDRCDRVADTVIQVIPQGFQFSSYASEASANTLDLQQAGRLPSEFTALRGNAWIQYLCITSFRRASQSSSFLWSSSIYTFVGVPAWPETLFGPEEEDTKPLGLRHCLESGVGRCQHSFSPFCLQPSTLRPALNSLSITSTTEERLLISRRTATEAR